jgi:hypothetical protein
MRLHEWESSLIQQEKRRMYDTVIGKDARSLL